MSNLSDNLKKLIYIFFLITSITLLYVYFAKQSLQSTKNINTTKKISPNAYFIPPKIDTKEVTVTGTLISSEDFGQNITHKIINGDEILFYAYSNLIDLNLHNNVIATFKGVSSYTAGGYQVIKIQQIEL